MAAVANPALDQFLATLSKELVLAQVLVTRLERGFELRHVQDRERSAEALTLLPLAGLRPLAQVTAAGAFRPLRAAPSLRVGWRALAATAAELGTALSHLYPGGLADWYALQVAPPPVTHYREFASRQTGVFRLTQLLTDDQAARVTMACCQKRFCLKRRLWAVGSLGPDPPQEKSLLPCLEPCAVFLEFARRAVRLEQDTAAPLNLTRDERSVLQFALETALRHPAELAPEADFNLPSNPRRIALLLEKLDCPQTSRRERE